MKVFLWKQKQVFEINRKEEIDSNTYLITDYEEAMIEETLKAGGELWISKGEIKWSGVKPDDVSLWNTTTKKWEIDTALYNARHEKRKEEMWEKIKQKRLEEITAGVYVPSIKKWLHTDDVSAIQYSQIGNAINLGIFEPMMWKTMDGSFITLTVDIFKEFQALMIKNTQKNYHVAEVHKALMEQYTNPLEYDYSTDWADATLTEI